VNIASSFSGKPVEVYNTVAEITGSEKPDEVVIIGGHLDSWGSGNGATDNGTGSWQCWLRRARCKSWGQAEAQRSGLCCSQVKSRG